MSKRGRPPKIRTEQDVKNEEALQRVQGESKQLIERLKGQKKKLEKAMELMKTEAGYDMVQEFFTNHSLDDIEQQWASLYATTKYIGILDPDIAKGLDLCRKILSDATRQLKTNEKRDEETREALRGMIDILRAQGAPEEDIKGVEMLIEAIK